MIPMCDQPREAPEPSARPIVGADVGLFNAVILIGDGQTL